MAVIRLLFLADTHLGFDYPFHPRIQRRRRGDDFFANYRKALEPAAKGCVDAVIHGGDLFFRSRVPAQLVDMAFSPLKEIADNGIPIYIVPGNHERSRIPFKILSLHPRIHIFSHPRTLVLEKNGFRLAMAGFPYWYDNVRARFPKILDQTEWKEVLAMCDAGVLCVHHCFEGATVGPSNYTFRYAKDVIRIQDIPPAFSAVLSGHIHRRQVLTQDLNGHPAAVPMFYPGSIERTSFAEKHEKKGYFTLTLSSREQPGRSKLAWQFTELPTRPMIKLSLSAQGLGPQKFHNLIQEKLAGLDPDSVVSISVEGPIPQDCLQVLRASSIRSCSPPQMNVSLAQQNFKSKEKSRQITSLSV